MAPLMRSMCGRLAENRLEYKEVERPRRCIRIAAAAPRNFWAAMVAACIAGCAPAGASSSTKIPDESIGGVEARAVEVILDLPESGSEPGRINYARLPRLSGSHAVVSAPDPVLKFQLHSYLIHHDGLYWCMWSQGPPVEDEPSQQVRYATSTDGLQWSESKPLTGLPPEGYAYIARGFWVREGKLLALVAFFKGKGPIGPNKELQLRALSWESGSREWKQQGMVFENALNNYPPERLGTGEWMLTRRDSRFNVYVLIGGQRDLSSWEVIPVVKRREVPGFTPDEPIWWKRADGSLVALFRDNAGTYRLFLSTSADHGRTWSPPVMTNFPNSPSKLFSLPVADDCRILISNASPAAGRRELHLSVAPDGRTFRQMAVLAIPMPRASTLQYPHAIVHDGHVLITFSRKKAEIEVFRIPIRDIEAFCRPSVT